MPHRFRFHFSRAPLLVLAFAVWLGARPRADLTLAFSQPSYQVGEKVFLVISGTPGSPVILGMDFDPGPIDLPGIGTVHLGFSSSFGVLALNLPPSGSVVLDCDIVCDSPIVNHPQYFQAVAFDIVKGQLVLSNPATLIVTADADDCGKVFLVIDEDSVDNGYPPNFFSDVDVNDQMAEIAVRTPLAYFAEHVGEEIVLHTGTVGDEGWFAVKEVPSSWDDAGPSHGAICNFFGNPGQPFPHGVGPGLGTPDQNGDREALLDKVPKVTPLRATGLKMLEGRDVCAVVYDSDISINYGPLDGSLKGANLGTVAFRVLEVSKLTGYSSGSLPQVRIRILEVGDVCPAGDLVLFTDAPEPATSSLPFDVDP